MTGPSRVATGQQRPEHVDCHVADSSPPGMRTRFSPKPQSIDFLEKTDSTDSMEFPECLENHRAQLTSSAAVLKYFNPGAVLSNKSERQLGKSVKFL